MRNQRSSNLELLRIFAMMIIIVYHIFLHGVKVQLTDLKSIERMENGWFCTPVFDARLLLPVAMSPLGLIGNAVFVLISGYFLVEKGSNINLTKITQKLFGQQLFAALLLAIASTVAWTRFPDQNISLVSFNVFNTMNWFIGYYLMLMVIAALFLNRLLGSLNREQYLAFLLCVFGLSQFAFSDGIINGFSNNLDRIFVGVFLYALGGGIKRFGFFDHVKAVTWMLVLALLSGLVLLSGYNLICDSVREYLLTEGSKPFVPGLGNYLNRHFLCVISGVALFELFRKLPAFKSRIINYLGGSTMMVYLIHDTEFFRSIWNLQDWITLLYNDPKGFVKQVGLTVAVVFGLGVAVYTVYIIIEAIVKWCWKCSKERYQRAKQ